jgi:hypothetical protein
LNKVGGITTLRLLYTRKDLEATIQEARWASGPVWTARKNLPPPGFDPHTIQHVASCYTNYAICACVWGCMRAPILCNGGLVGQGDKSTFRKPGTDEWSYTTTLKQQKSTILSYHFNFNTILHHNLGLS